MSNTLTDARTHYLRGDEEKREREPLGSRWDHFRRDMAAAIAGFRTVEDAIAYGQLRCGFDHRGPVTEADIPKIKIAQHLLRYEYQEFREQILRFSETRITTPGTAIEFTTDYNGIRAFGSQILYFHAFYLLTLLRFKPDIDSVCEIGGGYGNPALLWLTNPIRPLSRYIIFDIPESLFFAEVFLRTALPEMPFHYVTEQDPVSDRPGITLVPIHLASQTRAVQFDVVTNTGSVAEMTNEWVDHWSRWLGEQRASLFYSHNVFANPLERMHEARSTFAPAVPPGWRPVYIRANHPMMMLHDTERWAAEIIFKRVDDRRDAAAMLDFLDGAKLSPENYLHLLYALMSDLAAAKRIIPRFTRKVISDFGHPPVELLHLLNAIDTDDREALTLKGRMERVFRTHYPQGAYSH